jgi:hypothetical protein
MVDFLRKVAKYIREVIAGKHIYMTEYIRTKLSPELETHSQSKWESLESVDRNYLI